MKQIHTIEIYADYIQFDSEVNESLKKGYTIESINCGVFSYDTEGSNTVYQAILSIDKER